MHVPRFIPGAGQERLTETTCAACGTPIEVPPSRAKKAKNLFCGQACYSAYQRREPSESELRDRLEAKIERAPDGCWNWTGAIRKATGYGSFSMGSSRGTTTAHRAAYLLLAGPIPDGYWIDHLCRNRRCVNPEHLEAVPPAVNTHRGESPLIRANHEQVCRRGHSYAEHSYYRDGKRICCRACERENQRRRSRS